MRTSILVACVIIDTVMVCVAPDVLLVLLIGGVALLIVASWAAHCYPNRMIP